MHLVSFQDLVTQRHCLVSNFTHSGDFWLICCVATMGGAYAFVRSASANLRRTNDPYNEFFGGLAAGAVAGLRSTSLLSKLSVFF